MDLLHDPLPTGPILPGWEMSIILCPNWCFGLIDYPDLQVVNGSVPTRTWTQSDCPDLLLSVGMRMDPIGNKEKRRSQSIGESICRDSGRHIQWERGGIVSGTRETVSWKRGTSKGREEANGKRRELGGWAGRGARTGSRRVGWEDGSRVVVDSRLGSGKRKEGNAARIHDLCVDF